MIIPTVFLCLLFVMLVVRAVRAGRRRREARTMIVTNCPDIELRQCYGGWDADAYDAHSGRDHSWRLRTSPGAYLSRLPLHRAR